MISALGRRLAPATLSFSSASKSLCTPAVALRAYSSSSQSSSTPSAVTPSATPSANLEEEYKPEIEDILSEYESRMKRRQAKIGYVVSAKNAKSISVRVDSKYYFPKYDSYQRRSHKIMAHDETMNAKLGDLVRIVPCRPRSAKKRHELIDIIRRAETPSAETAPQ